MIINTYNAIFQTLIVVFYLEKTKRQIWKKIQLKKFNTLRESNSGAAPWEKLSQTRSIDSAKKRKLRFIIVVREDDRSMESSFEKRTQSLFSVSFASQSDIFTAPE